jgi:hypothetical protein
MQAAKGPTLFRSNKKKAPLGESGAPLNDGSTGAGGSRDRPRRVNNAVHAVLVPSHFNFRSG